MNMNEIVIGQVRVIEVSVQADLDKEQVERLIKGISMVIEFENDKRKRKGLDRIEYNTATYIEGIEIEVEGEDETENEEAPE